MQCDRLHQDILKSQWACPLFACLRFWTVGHYGFFAPALKYILIAMVYAVESGTRIQSKSLQSIRKRFLKRLLGFKLD